MDDIVKLDKDYYETHNEDMDESFTAEDIHIKDNGKDVTLCDVLVFQLVLCVLIIIAVIVIKAVNADLAYKAAEQFKTEASKTFDYKNEFNHLISQITGFFNAKF